EGGEPGLLHRVLGFAGAAEDAADHAVDARVVAAQQQLEQRAIAGDDAVDQLLVGEVGRGPAVCALDHLPEPPVASIAWMFFACCRCPWSVGSASSSALFTSAFFTAGSRTV